MLLFFPAKQWLVTRARGGDIHIHQIQNDEIIKIHTIPYSLLPAIPFGVDISPDGELLALGLSNEPFDSAGEFQLWRTSDWSLWRTFGNDKIGGGSSVSFSPDSRLLLAGHHDGYVRIWQIADGTLLQEIPSQCDSPSVAFSLNTNWFAFNGTDDSTLTDYVELWDASSVKYLRRIGGYDPGIDCWKLSTTGTYIAIAPVKRPKRPVEIWDMKNDTLIHRLLLDIGVFRIAFSPDDQIVALSTFDHEIQAFSVLDGSHLWTISDLADDYYEIAFINNSALIIASNNTNTIQIRHLGE
jgi:WD40 repeat protein